MQLFSKGKSVPLQAWSGPEGKYNQVLLTMGKNVARNTWLIGNK